MNIISDSDLLAYNQQGLLPGPNENENEFLQRVRLFTDQRYQVDRPCMDSLKKAKELYDIEPDWVQIEYTNLGLRFWEAAQVESGPKYFKFQLRKSFLNQPKYLGLYCKKEILAHEFAHVGRMAYPASRYEEVFAFESSQKLRKVLGPLFSTPNESFTLVILTIMSMLSDFVLGSLLYAYIAFKTLPVLYLGFLGLRLLFSRRHYKKTQKKLGLVLQNPKQVRYVMYRLTDAEILHFSKSRLSGIKKYIHEQKDLRWRLIHLAYFNSAA